MKNKRLLYKLKEKEYKVMNVGDPSMSPILTQSQKKDSTFKKVFFTQPSTPTSLSCFYCQKMRLVSLMCKKTIINGVYRWVPKEKKNDAKKDNSTFSRDCGYGRIKSNYITKEKDKDLKISYRKNMKKINGRRVVNKMAKGSNKLGICPLLFKNCSSKPFH